jgi:hypothetical protein
MPDPVTEVLVALAEGVMGWKLRVIGEHRFVDVPGGGHWRIGGTWRPHEDIAQAHDLLEAWKGGGNRGRSADLAYRAKWRLTLRGRRQDQEFIAYGDKPAEAIFRAVCAAEGITL